MVETNLMVTISLPKNIIPSWLISLGILLVFRSWFEFVLVF